MWGLFIIVIGIGLLMRQTGFIHIDIGEVVRLFWPAFLIFLGLQGLLRRAVSGGGSYWGSWILMIVGAAFLSRNFGFFFNWQTHDLVQSIVPLVIILFGLRMIMRPRKRNTAAPSDEWKAYSYGPTDDSVPPAPPLHPDPTKSSPDDREKGAPFSEGEAGPADAGTRTGYDQQSSGIPDSGGRYYGKHGFHGMHRGYRMERKMDRWERKAERMRERLEYHARRHAGRHNRTEWWNYDPNVQNRSGFIGDIYVGQDYWELKPMNISHFIGDTVLDLTKAQILPGETRINISSFIGDVKVFLPNDFEIGVNVVSSAFIGDVAVLDRKEGGMFRNMNVETPYFHETDKKIKLVVSTFIGDVRVSKVG